MQCFSNVNQCWTSQKVIFFDIWVPYQSVLCDVNRFYSNFTLASVGSPTCPSPLSLWFSQFQYYCTTFIQPYCGLLQTRAPPLLLAGPFSSPLSLCFSKFEYYYTFIQPYCGLKQISFVEPHQCYKPGNFLTSQLPARWRWRIQQSIITSLWPH